MRLARSTADWAQRVIINQPGVIAPWVVRVASRLLYSLGAIPSSYQAAQQTLARDVPILIFPGGGHETLRLVLDGKHSR